MNYAVEEGVGQFYLSRVDGQVSMESLAFDSWSHSPLKGSPWFNFENQSF